MDIIDNKISYYNGFLKVYHYGQDRQYDRFEVVIGKQIHSVRLEKDELVFKFTDRTGVAIWDDGQSCCEHRYMTCDDDLTQFEGAILLGAEQKEVEFVRDDSYGDHEIKFLEVFTNLGSFTLASHNEHNGYYGGFSLRAKNVV